MDRKKFIKICSAGAFAAGLPALASGCVPYRYAASSFEDGVLSVSKNEFGENQFVLVKNPESKAPVFLKKHSEITYTALSMECTHKGCSVDPEPSQLRCPCHGSRFTHTGAVLEGPARKPLRELGVEADNDKIYINI